MDQLIFSHSLPTISGDDTVEEGESITLTAVTTPSGTALTWSCDDTEKATLSDGSSMGVTVTGVAAGTVTITAVFTDDADISATWTVEVTAAEGNG